MWVRNTATSENSNVERFLEDLEVFISHVHLLPQLNQTPLRHEGLTEAVTAPHFSNDVGRCARTDDLQRSLRGEI